MPKRTYRDPRTQRAYDGTVLMFASGVRGWQAPMVHGLWNDDGRRFRGSSTGSAFWNGFDSVDLDQRPWRERYVRTSACWIAYNAGRDCAGWAARKNDSQECRG
jgi:hypothetical protein